MSHRALLGGHLALLRARFLELAGQAAPEQFADRGGRPPELEGRTLDMDPPAGLLSDVRRTEWAAFGLDAILELYGQQAADSAAIIRDARDALRAWTVQARVDV